MDVIEQATREVGEGHLLVSTAATALAMTEHQRNPKRAVDVIMRYNEHVKVGFVCLYDQRSWRQD
jgi:hypothetical protein